jgi:glycosyltransferase involved in cell wall biosynthesis
MNKCQTGRAQEQSATPLVSVVVTTYNRREYLIETINSILIQTMENFELIVSDDANSTDIAHVCIDFNDKRIKYVGNKQRLGMLDNTKQAMKKANGKYIANIHDDDLIDPLFLEIMTSHMEKNKNIGLVFCDHLIIDCNGVVDASASDINTKIWGRDKLSEGIVTNRTDVFFDGAITAPSGRLFRSGSINLEEIYKDVGVNYDLWMSFLHCKSSFDCYYVDRRLMSYRVHPDSQTESGDNGTASIFILTYFLKNCLYPEKVKIIKKRLARASFRAAKKMLLQGDNILARGLLIDPIKKTGSLRCIMAYLIAHLPPKISVMVISKAERVRGNSLNKSKTADNISKENV